VKGILPGYLDDWRSAGFATHLVFEMNATANAVAGGGVAARIPRHYV
jgi:hypothetical protein